METGCERLDLVKVGRLDFEAPDLERFPALRIAREALEAGGAKPGILSAANEVAVASFLASGIAFLDIAALVSDVLHAFDPAPPASIEEVLEVDAEARRRATQAVGRYLN
jgi:1-deoxy-D-xylulose-5-phosphate reductoisomerase